jgi:hypothetical protein
MQRILRFISEVLPFSLPKTGFSAVDRIRRKRLGELTVGDRGERAGQFFYAGLPRMPGPNYRAPSHGDSARRLKNPIPQCVFPSCPPNDPIGAPRWSPSRGDLANWPIPQAIPSTVLEKCEEGRIFMPFVTTHPQALVSVAGALHDIAPAMSVRNATALAPTTGVVPATADEVSALTAAQFAAHA